MDRKSDGLLEAFRAPLRRRAHARREYAIGEYLQARRMLRLARRGELVGRYRHLTAQAAAGRDLMRAARARMRLVRIELRNLGLPPAIAGGAPTAAELDAHAADAAASLADVPPLPERCGDCGSPAAEMDLRPSGHGLGLVVCGRCTDGAGREPGSAVWRLDGSPAYARLLGSIERDGDEVERQARRADAAYRGAVRAARARGTDDLAETGGRWAAHLRAVARMDAALGRPPAGGTR